MKKKFCMNDCLEIIDSPDRSNIKLFVHKYKSTLPLSELLGFILNSVQTKKDKCERCIIFCPSIKLCSDVYTMFRLELKDDIKFVQMFHSMTVDDVKEEVRADMNLSSGKIRVLVATSAAGMGVNFAGVNSIIHVGPPKDMDSFVQQFGRSGRDGSQAMSLLLYSSKQCKKLDEDMTSYISTDTCRRKLLLSSYNAEPPKLCKHMCCDICTKTCSCEDCSKFNHPFFEYAVPCYESQSSSDSDICDSDDDMI
jgi:ATP-dependent DNA helicase RecQ